MSCFSWCYLVAVRVGSLSLQQSLKSLTRLWIYGFCFTNFFFWNVYVLLHVLSSKVLSWSRKTSEGCTSWVIILRQIILPGNKLQVICELIIAETFAILNKWVILIYLLGFLKSLQIKMIRCFRCLIFRV